MQGDIKFQLGSNLVKTAWRHLPQDICGTKPSMEADLCMRINNTVTSLQNNCVSVLCVLRENLKHSIGGGSELLLIPTNYLFGSGFFFLLGLHNQGESWGFYILYSTYNGEKQFQGRKTLAR